jgi:excinuclease ABC subunit A
VDVGPAAGEQGGHILYSGLRDVEASLTRHYIYDEIRPDHFAMRVAKDWLKLEGITRNNLVSLNVAFPLGVRTSVTGVSGLGKQFGQPGIGRTGRGATLTYCRMAV